MAAKKQTSKTSPSKTSPAKKSKPAARSQAADDPEDDLDEDELEEDLEDDEEPEEPEESEDEGVPDGWEERTSDIAGFYSGENSVMFIPQSVNLSDNSQDEVKTSCLIVGKLLKPARLNVRDDDGGEPELKLVKKGATVGVWYKPGMGAIVNLAGVPVFLKPNGTRKIKGRKEPMKLFKVMTKPGAVGTKIPLGGDFRDVSLNAKNPFTAPRKRGTATMADGENDVDTDGF